MSGMDDLSYTTVKTSATSYTLVKSDYFLTLQSLTGATTVTLPDPTLTPVGRQFIVQKDASAQTVTISSAGSANVDGGASVTLATGAAHSRVIMSDGTAWWTVAQF